MFYSHSYLAKKGPLGTVWCAAHLQHRLKKSQYTSTNIPKTVDLIMCPEAPMALRLSSHLLLGVVRIYSKKVDYLYRDYNLFSIWLAKAMISTQVDLPEDARQAPVESVTLPQTLNLDDFNLEDDTREEFDHHLRSVEDITLKDQIPTGVDPYVSITFEEDIVIETSPMDVDQATEPVSEHPGVTDVEMGPNNEQGDTEEIHERSNANSPTSVPEIEIRRDAAHDLSPGLHRSAQNVPLEGTEPVDETLNEKELNIPIIDEEMSHSREHTPFNLRSRSPGFAATEEEPQHFGEHQSIQLDLQPSPPPPLQARPRKRKHFDKVTVLTNRMMRERLEDPSDTLRKRKKMPSSKVNIWRLTNQSKKDHNVNEPLFTGFSNELRSVFEKDCVSSKPYLVVSASVSSPTQEAATEVNLTTPIQQSTVPDSTEPDTTVQLSPVRQTEDVQDFAHTESIAREAQSPPPSNNDDDTGIERLREGDLPFRTDDFTPQPESLETRSYATDPSTSTFPQDLPGQRNLGLSDIPEMVDEELNFLEIDGDTPVRSPASHHDSDALTGRTRAFVQYLKERSSSSPTSRSSSTEDLTLNKILAGKTRKIAARMFFETLVLKSRGLIDVQQDQPYSDIALKLMPSLFQKVQP